MSAVEILRQARELITDKSRWTQIDYARDRYGLPASTKDDTAACWCALGALEKACDGKDAFAKYDVAYSYLFNAAIRMFDDGVAAVNDGRANLAGVPAHDAVLKVYDAAIAKAEATNA